MNQGAVWCFVILGLVVPVGLMPAAAPPQRPEPLKGAVVSGRVLTCVRLPHERLPRIIGWFQPLRGGKPVSVDFLAAASYLPVRWQVGDGVLWVSNSAGSPGVGMEFQMRYELTELFQGCRVIGPGAKPNNGWNTYFVHSDAVADAIFLRVKAGFHTELQSDYLAAGRDRMKVFVLTNVDGRSASEGDGDSDSAVVRKFPQRPENRWSFTCHRLSARWDAKQEEWTDQEETHECSIDLVFREPFQALSRGEDYYFLTASGKLYRAPKPAKGKHRTLETVWDDVKSPIVAFIQDADRNRTFLFCACGPKGKGGPCVFELASGVRLRFYDKALFKPGDQGPDKLRQVVGYARVLEALGYVKSGR